MPLILTGYTDMPSEDKQYLSFLLKHIVCIAGVYENLEDKSIHGYVYSAFVMNRNDNIFIVTAGHNIVNLENALEDKNIRMLSCKLIDSVHPEAQHKLSLPFMLSAHEYQRLDSGGIDIAIIKLNQLEQQALLGNKIVPFNVYSQSFTKDDAFAFVGIIGFPQEYIKVGAGTIAFVPTLSPVLPIDSSMVESSVMDKYKYTVMTCKLVDQNQPSSFKGVSGAPVFAFKEIDGKMVYEIIGIQSEWLPSSRIVIITLFSTIINELLRSPLKNPT